MTIYSSPQEFGLEVIDSIDYSSGDYCFDYRVVWRRLLDGKLLSARDSGCSCPSPFEDVSLNDLQEVESTGWLKEEIAKEGQSYLSVADSSAFIEKVEKALEDLNSGKYMAEKNKDNKKEVKEKKERHDTSWRHAAISDLEVAASQISQAINALKNEEDYSGQIHGHSALEKISGALGNMAAAIARK